MCYVLCIIQTRLHSSTTNNPDTRLTWRGSVTPGQLRLEWRSLRGAAAATASDAALKTHLDGRHGAGGCARTEAAAGDERR